MTQASVPTPSVKLTSFACPNCGAHSTQTWYSVTLERLTGGNPTPYIPTLEDITQRERVDAELAKRSIWVELRRIKGERHSKAGPDRLQSGHL